MNGARKLENRNTRRFPITDPDTILILDYQEPTMIHHIKKFLTRSAD